MTKRIAFKMIEEKIDGKIYLLSYNGKKRPTIYTPHHSSLRRVKGTKEQNIVLTFHIAKREREKSIVEGLIKRK